MYVEISWNLLCEQVPPVRAGHSGLWCCSQRQCIAEEKDQSRKREAIRKKCALALDVCSYRGGGRGLQKMSKAKAHSFTDGLPKSLKIWIKKKRSVELRKGCCLLACLRKE